MTAPASDEPAVLWRAEADGMTAEARWLSATEEIEVVVGVRGTTMHERFRPFHEPRFGIDVVDLGRAQELAEQLAQRLDRVADTAAPSGR